MVFFGLSVSLCLWGWSVLGLSVSLWSWGTITPSLCSITESFSTITPTLCATITPTLCTITPTLSPITPSFCTITPSLCTITPSLRTRFTLWWGNYYVQVWKNITVITLIAVSILVHYSPCIRILQLVYLNITVTLLEFSMYWGGAFIMWSALRLKVIIKTSTKNIEFSTKCTLVPKIMKIVPNIMRKIPKILNSVPN